LHQSKIPAAAIRPVGFHSRLIVGKDLVNFLIVIAAVD